MKTQTFSNILKNYRWQSFLFKNFIMIFCILIFPLAIFSFVIFNNYKNNVIQSIEHSDSKSTMLAADYLDRQFAEVEDFFINIKSSNSYSNDLTMLLNTDSINSELIIESSNNIFKHLEDFLLVNNVISSVYIYSASSDYVFSPGFPSSNYLEYFHDSSVITDDNGIYNYPFFRTVQINRSSYDMLSVVYPIDSSKIIFNINFNLLKKNILDVNPNLSDFYILDSENRLLYSSDENYPLFSDGTALTTTAADIDKDNCLTSCSDSNELNLKYVFKNQYPDYTKTRHTYIQTVFLLILLVLTLTIGISFALTMALYKHILSLIDILNPYIPSDDTGASNEMQLITNSILAITSQNSDLRQELAQRLNVLKTAQASMLQTQINPHFLYNTLNSINSIVLFTFKKETQISDIITNLSEILRYSSNASEYLVSLETELYYLQKYIDIQMAKYINRFTIEYHISDNTKKLKLIKLSLQPLIENSIIHGILPKRSKGLIKIYSETKDNSLLIKIEDNGIGISENKLKELTEKIKNDVFVLDKSLGVENTAKRIRLIFGNNYGLNISSSEAGTTILLTMPIIE